MTLLRPSLIAISALAVIIGGCSTRQDPLAENDKTQSELPSAADSSLASHPPAAAKNNVANPEVPVGSAINRSVPATAYRQKAAEENKFNLQRDDALESAPSSTIAEPSAAPLASAAPPPPPPSPDGAVQKRRSRMEVIAGAPADAADFYYQPQPANTEQYAHTEISPVKLVAEQPVSTFSIDVDTGSYANVRRFLHDGQLPPPDAVRVEEMLNYFSYDYPRPAPNAAPFAVSVETAPAPWNGQKQLLRIGIKGKDLAKETLPPANLVFLVDVSGSMESPDKLPLLQSALKIFSQSLRAQDRISLVVYAGSVGVVLPPTSGADKAVISAALNALQAGGSTNGEGGIQLAYAMAQQGYIAGGINRILLTTDGDFNVGLTDFDALKNLVAEKRKTGVSLSTLGFGTGNLNDQLMEQIADVGNGNYSYIDTLNEAQKVLVDEFTSTLATIAKDVKIQIEFNPDVVAEYRLIGYENRALKREDFNNDRIDAGEIGAGHTVTALYEIGLANGRGNLIEPLRYGAEQAVSPAESSASKPSHGELAFLRLRYKQPDAEQSQLLEIPVAATISKAGIAAASPDFRFAAAVSAFGQLLHGGQYTGQFSYADVLQLAQGARGEDSFGYRSEFLSLVNVAKSLAATTPPLASRSYPEAGTTPVLR